MLGPTGRVPRDWSWAWAKGWPQTTCLVDCNLPTHNEQRIGLNGGKGLKAPTPPIPATEGSQMVEKITPGMEGQMYSSPADQAEPRGALA